MFVCLVFTVLTIVKTLLSAVRSAVYWPPPRCGQPFPLELAFISPQDFRCACEMSQSEDAQDPSAPSPGGTLPSLNIRVHAEDVREAVAQGGTGGESSHGFGAGSSQEAPRGSWTEILAQARNLGRPRPALTAETPPSTGRSTNTGNSSPREENAQIEMALGVTFLNFLGLTWDWFWERKLHTTGFIALVALSIFAWRSGWFAKAWDWLCDTFCRAYYALQDLGRDELPPPPEGPPPEAPPDAAPGAPQDAPPDAPPRPRRRGRRSTGTIFAIALGMYVVILFPIMHVGAIRTFGTPMSMENRFQEQFSAFGTTVEDLSSCPLGERLEATWWPTLWGWYWECRPLIFDLDERILHAAFQESLKEALSTYLGVNPRMYRDRPLTEVIADATEFSRQWAFKAQPRGEALLYQMKKLQTHYEAALEAVRFEREQNSVWYKKFSLPTASEYEDLTADFLEGTVRSIDQINLSILRMAREIATDIGEPALELLAAIDRSIASASRRSMDSIRGQLSGKTSTVRELMPAVTERAEKLTASAGAVSRLVTRTTAPPPRSWKTWFFLWYSRVATPFRWGLGLLRHIISPDAMDELLAVTGHKSTMIGRNFATFVGVLVFVGVLMTLALIATAVKRIADGIHSVMDLGRETMHGIYGLLWMIGAVLYVPFWIAYWVFVYPWLLLGNLAFPPPPPARPRRVRTNQIRRRAGRQREREANPEAAERRSSGEAPRQEQAPHEGQEAQQVASPRRPPQAEGPPAEARDDRPASGNEPPPPQAPRNVPTQQDAGPSSQPRNQPNPQRGRGYVGRGRHSGGRGRGRRGQRTGYDSDGGQSRRQKEPRLAWELRPVSDGEEGDLPYSQRPAMPPAYEGYEDVLARLRRVEERQAAAPRAPPPPPPLRLPNRSASPAARAPRQGRPALQATLTPRPPPRGRCANCNARDHTTSECPLYWQQVVHLPAETSDEGPSDRPPVAAVWDAASSSDASRLYYVRAKLAERDRPIQMLVDSGSSVCVMPTERCVQGGWEIQPLEEPIEIQAFNGVATPVRGQVELPVNIGGEARNVPFLVVDGPEHPIVGVNALRDFGWSLDFAGNRLLAPDGRSVMCAAVRTTHHPN